MTFQLAVLQLHEYKHVSFKLTLDTANFTLFLGEGGTVKFNRFSLDFSRNL